jgi:triosephosphate isomerase
MAKASYAIGNWKMYKTAHEAVDYIDALLPLIEGVAAEAYLAVPFTSIASAAQRAKKSPLKIGAQNMHDAREGAFTGEIAALMLKEAGASFVLIGHSERRRLFKETLEMIARKVQRALQDHLEPVLCVGETLEEREGGKTEAILKEQLFSALDAVPDEDAKKLLIAYEPVWAIGTGKSATPEMAAEAHAICRAALKEIFGARRAAPIPILYGGSVKSENAPELMAQKGIDGLLVGGASLSPETFASIIHSVAGKRP